MSLTPIERTFISAIHYDLAGQILHDQTTKEPHGMTLLFPAVTLDAFSVELYLKCVLQMEGKEKRVHDFIELFNMISIQGQQTIIDIYNSTVLTMPQVKPLINFPPDIPKTGSFIELLTTGKDAFEASRYIHNPDPNKKFLGLWGMPIKLAIRRYILTIEFEWYKHIPPRVQW